MSLKDLAFNRQIKINVSGLEMSGLRCSVNIAKNLKKDPNSCDIIIYNLSPETRNKLTQLAPKNDEDEGIPVRIEVGYKDQKEGLSQIWFGDLRTVISSHEIPDWKTILTSGDGEKASQISKMSQVFGANTPIDVVIKALVNELRKSLGSQNLPNDVQVQNLIRSVKMQGGGNLLAGTTVLTGSTVNLLDSYCKSCGLEFSIQDGNLQILEKEKPTQDLAIQIVGGSAGSGVIGIPSVDAKGIIKFRHLILPGFKPGRKINITTEAVTGFYRITKLVYVADTWEKEQFYVDIEAERIG